MDLKLVSPAPPKLDCLPNYRCEESEFFTFKPGQWIDVYVPHLSKPGGFSFVSTLKTFRQHGIASLAIQHTDNPPSQWLWQDKILGQYVKIRVGGNFTFPPLNPTLKLHEINYIQFVAGGVGIKYFPRISPLTLLVP